MRPSPKFSRRTSTNDSALGRKKCGHEFKAYGSSTPFQLEAARSADSRKMSRPRYTHFLYRGLLLRPGRSLCIALVICIHLRRGHGLALTNHDHENTGVEFSRQLCYTDDNTTASCEHETSGDCAVGGRDSSQRPDRPWAPRTTSQGTGNTGSTDADTDVVIKGKENRRRRTPSGLRTGHFWLRWAGRTGIWLWRGMDTDKIKWESAAQQARARTHRTRTNRTATHPERREATPKRHPRHTQASNAEVSFFKSAQPYDSLPGRTTSVTGVAAIEQYLIEQPRPLSFTGITAAPLDGLLPRCFTSPEHERLRSFCTDSVHPSDAPDDPQIKTPLNRMPAEFGSSLPDSIADLHEIDTQRGFTCSFSELGTSSTDSETAFGRRRVHELPVPILPTTTTVNDFTRAIKAQRTKTTPKTGMVDPSTHPRHYRGLQVSER
ncbi:unnamed protein product [Zymoseptoria tritici ST99CH_1E4]|uniref:Uncharacterized protein n=1 Tax=Zymoseptoria tritici ST99CH_1E4 TaxID=1276532 RepID=A0A2H1H9B0_ZYMTR|nr:unnamed protein product [Zymoseptoria tritici ST99CH_1E4]